MRKFNMIKNGIDHTSFIKLLFDNYDFSIFDDLSVRDNLNVYTSLNKLPNLRRFLFNHSFISPRHLYVYIQRVYEKRSFLSISVELELSKQTVYGLFRHAQKSLMFVRCKYYIYDLEKK